MLLSQHMRVAASASRAAARVFSSFPTQMKLADKGPYSDPPRLPGKHGQLLVDIVSQWPGVHTRAHYEIGSFTAIDGTDFYVGQDELGHIHDNSDAHIPNTMAVTTRVVAAKLATHFRWDRHTCAQTHKRVTHM